MKFVQTIAWKTSRADEMLAAMDRFFAEHPEPGPGFLGAKVLKDRERANTYLVVAEFESYDLAMQNSARPEIGQLNQELMRLADVPPTFTNYDVIDERA